jgi:limonene-1,2-epoxide hydrolase
LPEVGHVKPDDVSETELIEVLDHFCSGFASRDAETVLRACALDPDLVVVTSEEALLRGPAELRAFLDRYVEGPTTYSWQWDRRDVSTAGSVAWLLAEGTETAATEERVLQHPYRMTVVLEHRDGRWLVRQVHGSSPH